MKTLSRKFNRREKILVVILAIIVAALLYYYFLYTPITESIQQAESEITTLEDRQLILSTRLAKLKNMEKEVEEIKASGITSTMLSYNGSKEEISFLNDVLTKAETYNITFTKVTRNTNQIRRSFTLKFTATNYEKAKEILTDLYECEYRLQIGDLVINTRTESYTTVDGVISAINYDERYTVSLTATFFETMVGGTADAGLPEDSDAKATE